MMKNNGAEQKKLLETCAQKHEFFMPFEIDEDNQYQGKLEEKLARFCEVLSMYDDVPSWAIEEAQGIKAVLSEVIALYYDGDLSGAQDAILKLMDSLDTELAVSAINRSISFGYTFPSKKTRSVEFFRGRINEDRGAFKKEKMVNLPFAQRQLADVQRFSILGMPCLYLGTSSYVCWLELGKPEFGVFNVSPVYLSEDQKVLNLTITIENVIKIGFANKENGKALLKLFMLTMATSFVVADKNRRFKSEYVLSQLIMLACKKKQINGVAYFSKKIKLDYTAVGTGINVAIIPDMTDESLIPTNVKCLGAAINCAFFEQMKCIRPTEMLHELNMQGTGGYYELIYEGLVEVEYKNTTFYSLDKYLCSKLDWEIREKLTES